MVVDFRVYNKRGNDRDLLGYYSSVDSQDVSQSGVDLDGDG